MDHQDSEYRNDLCPCGSGKNVVRCCIASEDQNPVGGNDDQSPPPSIADVEREFRKHTRCWVNGCEREIEKSCTCDPDGAVLCVHVLLNAGRVDDAKQLAGEYDMRVVHGEDAYTRTRNLGTQKSVGIDYGASWAANGVSLGSTVDDLCSKWGLALRDAGFAVLHWTDEDGTDPGFEILGKGREFSDNTRVFIMPRKLCPNYYPIDKILTVSRIEGRLIDLRAEGATESLVTATRIAIPGLKVGDQVVVGFLMDETGDDLVRLSGIPGEPRLVISYIGRKGIPLEAPPGSKPI